MMTERGLGMDGPLSSPNVSQGKKFLGSLLTVSGGEQKMLAIGRGLMANPQILLLDEPLSNLDAGLRVELREEIRRIQRAARVTTLYVTHDQTEAMVLSDRVIVMNQGRIAPDANSTIRFTYGPVKGYRPRDGVVYLAQTTLTGVIEKETGAYPFEVPGKLKKLYQDRDFGRYTDKYSKNTCRN
jgi:energy-coupling factor transporter ATP-binding protein EcfA2